MIHCEKNINIKKTSIIFTFALTIVMSYLLYNYTILGIILANLFILLTGILNYKVKANNLTINYMSILFSIIIIILTINGLPTIKINIILGLDIIFLIYFSISDSFLEIKK